MKVWLLDTNVVSQPQDRLAQWADMQPGHALFISILTLAEYRKGIAQLTIGHALRPRLEPIIHSVETRFAGRILPVSNAIALRWGAIAGEVKRLTGHPPAVIDTMLAATAIEHNLYLATRNIADVKHSGAAVFNPWKDDPLDFPLF